MLLSELSSQAIRFRYRQVGVNLPIFKNFMKFRLDVIGCHHTTSVVEVYYTKINIRTNMNHTTHTENLSFM